MGRYSITKKQLDKSCELFESAVKKERELLYITRKRKY